MDHRNWTENSSRTRVPIDGADIRTRRQWGIRTENAGKWGISGILRGFLRDFLGKGTSPAYGQKGKNTDGKERKGKSGTTDEIRGFWSVPGGHGQAVSQNAGRGSDGKKIYSYASRNQLLDRIHDFVGTMKDDLRQEGIRKREELRPEHVENIWK